MSCKTYLLFKCVALPLCHPLFFLFFFWCPPSRPAFPGLPRPGSLPIFIPCVSSASLQIFLFILLSSFILPALPSPLKVNVPLHNYEQQLKGGRMGFVHL